MGEANEQVLVVPATVLEPYLDMFRDGALVVTQPNVAYLDELFAALMEKAFFMDRAAAETDPTFLQLIPYCVLAETFDQTGFFALFAYRRTKQAGEVRLQGNWSYGVGGHINPVDGPGGRCTYDLALRRELKEEVGLELDGPLGEDAPVLGLIYDPSNEVGRVHLGVVHKVYVGDSRTLKFDDPAMADGEWFFRESPVPAPLENWSAILLARFGEKLW